MLLVDAPIRERNAIEEAECRAEENISNLGCREGLGEVTSSTTRGPYAVGENWVCLLSRGPLAAKGWMVEGEGPMRPPTARPKKSDAGGLFLHIEPWGVGMTDLSEESMLEADRYALAVWSRLLACLKKLSGRPIGPLQVNPPAWLSVGKWSATGSPDRGRGRMCLGSAPTSRLLSR